jgi:pimeloyl-ACP methyl ester carboxylesterase
MGNPTSSSPATRLPLRRGVAAMTVWFGWVGPASGCSLRRTMDTTMVRRAERMGLESTTLHQDALDLHYYRSKDPPAERPLLILHGFGGDGLTNWAGQLDALASDRPLLLPDLLWFGQSTSDADPGLRSQAEAMVALLDAEEVPRADIMAISYGGFVAFGMMEIAPERIGRLILVDTPGPLFSASDVSDLVRGHGVERPADLFVPEAPEDLQALFSAVMVHPPKLPEKVWSALYESYFQSNHEAQKALLADLPRQRMLLDHVQPADLEVPLIVWGAEDRIFPLESGEALAEAVGGHLVVIHNAAHAPNFEQRKAFNAIVAEWLDAPAPLPGRTDVHPR